MEDLLALLHAGTPKPNKDSTEVKLIPTELATGIIKENENYLGRVKYIHVCQEMADVIVFQKTSFCYSS